MMAAKNSNSSAKATHGKQSTWDRYRISEAHWLTQLFYLCWSATQDRSPPDYIGRLILVSLLAATTLAAVGFFVEDSPEDSLFMAAGAILGVAACGMLIRPPSGNQKPTTLQTILLFLSVPLGFAAFAVLLTTAEDVIQPDASEITPALTSFSASIAGCSSLILARAAYLRNKPA